MLNLPEWYISPGNSISSPQVQIVDTAVDGVAHAAARHRQYHLIIRVGVDHRLDILPVCIQAHDNLTVLQGGTGILLR